MESSWFLRPEELLFLAACLSNCWGVCLCVCVCLEGRVFRRGGGGVRMGSSWRWQLSRAMRLSLRWCRPQRGARAGGGTAGARLSELWSYTKLLLRSLYFNSLSDSDTLLDCAFEPIYWVVDNVTRWFGVVRPVPRSSPRSASTLTLLHPPGVRLPGGAADVLRGAHRLHVRPPHRLQDVLHLLDRLALRLRSLAAPHDRLPLLQGHRHPPGTPPQGTRLLSQRNYIGNV